LNISEGNGKFSPAERKRYFETARGSAFECASALDVMVAKRMATEEAIIPGKELLVDIVSMLVVMIQKLASQVREEPPEYCIRTVEFEHEHEHEHEHD